MRAGDDGKGEEEEGKKTLNLCEYSCRESTPIHIALDSDDDEGRRRKYMVRVEKIKSSKKKKKTQGHQVSNFNKIFL